MLQASCIYLGLIDPCPETFHPLHLPRRLITPCPTTNAISTKEYPNIWPDWLFPYHFHKPPYKYGASLIPLGLSLVLRPTVAPPCLNKGNLLPLRLSLLFCLGLNNTLYPSSLISTSIHTFFPEGLGLELHVGLTLWLVDPKWTFLFLLAVHKCQLLLSSKRRGDSQQLWGPALLKDNVLVWECLPCPGPAPVSHTHIVWILSGNQVGLGLLTNPNSNCLPHDRPMNPRDWFEERKRLSTER